METREDAATIGLVDDHPIMRAALRTALSSLQPLPRFVEAQDLPGVLRIVSDYPGLDLLLMDLHMPGAANLDGVAAVRRAAPTLPIAIVTAEEDPVLVGGLLDLGVAAFIPKSDPADVIVRAVQVVLSGGQYVPPRLLQRAGRNGADRADAQPLTARQREVLQLLATGLPNKLIARELGLTEGTVKVHLLAIFRVLGVRNRTEAVLAAQRLRL